MNTEDKAPKAPASVLFQAPEFAPPVFQEPAVTNTQPADTPQRKKSNKSSASKSPNGQKAGKKKSSQGGKSQGGKKPNAGATADESQKDQASNTGDGVQASSSADSASTSTKTKEESSSTKRRRRRPRNTGVEKADAESSDEVQGLKGSTRLEAKRMRRREGRRDSRRRQSITEAEFLARRESVDREMVIRHLDGSDQVAVLEDGILVEHFVARKTTQSIVGNIYLGRVQNVLPSMEAAFVDIGKGRNAVLYAGEVNWDALGMEGKPRKIESALKSGDTVMVQVSKDPIGHKGARLTSQITLAGRYLVFVPGTSILGISRKLPDTERARLKRILKEIVPDGAGVIVRTAAEGATEEQLEDDVERLEAQWKSIQDKANRSKKAPILLRGEPELVVRVARDLFNEDFKRLVVQGNETWEKVRDYVEELSPELEDRMEKWTSKEDVFEAKKINQQLAKAMDRKVWLPSGGTLIIERTEALTVVDVNTGKFVGSGGTLEETVTRNNLEAAEEIVRQLRLRDIGGIVIIDFVDMVLEANRELVLRRLVEGLGRDRTRHQVTEITSLGLVQMTRKRVGEGLVEAFSTTCEICDGRGFIVHDHPVELTGKGHAQVRRTEPRSEVHSRGQKKIPPAEPSTETHVGDEKVRSALSAIAQASRIAPLDEAPAPESVEQPAEQPAEQAAERAAEQVAPQVLVESEPGRAAEPVQRKRRQRRVAVRAAGSPGEKPTRGKGSQKKTEEQPQADAESAAQAVRSLIEGH